MCHALFLRTAEKGQGAEVIGNVLMKSKDTSKVFILVMQGKLNK